MIFLTGGTGFLGRELLGRLLLLYPAAKIMLLIRPGANRSAQERADALLQEMFGVENSRKFISRVEAVAGDVTELNFGLSDQSFKKLAAETHRIFHSAASISFDQALEDARRVNLFGTEQILSISREASRLNDNFHLHHVSTAYVVGDTEATVTPDALDLNVKFKNTYEQSKAESEHLVRISSAAVRSTIYRPSCIVGDSVTGQTSSFNVLYVVCRVIAKGLFEALPGVSNTPCDVVPVDYVAESIAALSKIGSPSGSCFHLCAGQGRETTPDEIIEFVIGTFNKYRKNSLRLLHHPKLIPPEMISLAQHSLALSYNIAKRGVKNIEKFMHRRLELFHQAATYAEYMTRNPRFDTSLTTQTLQNLVAPPPLFVQYAENLFRYCWDTNWGRLTWTNPRNLPTWHYRWGNSPVLK